MTLNQYIIHLYKTHKFITLERIAELATKQFGEKVSGDRASNILHRVGIRLRSSSTSIRRTMYDAQLSGESELLDLPDDLIHNMVCRKESP